MRSRSTPASAYIRPCRFRIMTGRAGKGFSVAGASGVVGRRLTPLSAPARVRGHRDDPLSGESGRAREIRRASAGGRCLRSARRRRGDGGRASHDRHSSADRPFRRVRAERQLESFTRNTRIRTEGTRNLVLAARAVGARRMIAQSLVWMYAPGPEPHREDDALDIAAEGTRAINVRGVVALERAVLEASPLEGVVLGRRSSTAARSRRARVVDGQVGQQREVMPSLPYVG